MQCVNSWNLLIQAKMPSKCNHSQEIFKCPWQNSVNSYNNVRCFLNQKIIIRNKNGSSELANETKLISCCYHLTYRAGHSAGSTGLCVGLN